MTNFLLIGACLLAGIMFRHTGVLGADAHKGINAWVLYIALPAVSFKFLPHIVWSADLLIPAVAPVIVWLGGWLVGRAYAVGRPISPQTRGAFTLSAGLSNTSFMGFPLVAAYFNDKAVGIAVICDQVTFFLLSTAGLIVAANTSGKHRLSIALILKKIARFPPFWGCIVALTLPRIVSISFLDPFFSQLAATVAPLALFSIGLQLQFAGWKKEIFSVSAALLYKLLLAPALVLALALLLKAKGIIPSVAIFEMAMPTLVTSGIIAQEYDLDAQLSGLIIGIGILLAFVTTAGWWFVITRFIGG